MNNQKRKIAILGSTGSIGRQALDVVDSHNTLFEVYALTANSNVSLLIEQARRYMPEVVIVANEDKYVELKEALDDLPIKVWCGSDAICDVVAHDEVDVVLTAMVGFSGLKPTISAIKAGKTIALANKETLVVAGELISSLALEHRSPILPVDSEHSAIFQCLNGEAHNRITKILLTSSGGPFRTYTKEELLSVTKEQALNHPCWSMGPKITIDSASMMNKGLEMIEARWLFDIAPEQIEVVVHPQSIIHSMVQFEDNSVMAQMGTPDMRLPIQYALSYPYRLKSECKPLDLFQIGNLSFEKPDMGKFRNLAIAYQSMNLGGNVPCIMNAANEIAVEAFLQDRISFVGMSDLIENVISKASKVVNPLLEDFLASDAEARRIAYELI